MWQSTIGAAMDGLAATIKSDGIRVVTGPAFADAAITPAVVVGWGGTGTDTPMVTARSAVDGYATNPTHESYTVACVAVCDSGSTSAEAVVEARDDALGLLGRVGSAVAADKTLGGIVMRAELADYSLTIQQTARGVTAFVEFGVAVDAQSVRSKP